MWVSLLIGCLLLHVTQGETPPSPNYAVVVPAVLLYPSSEKVCVYVSEPSKCTVEVNMTSNGKDDIPLMKRVSSLEPWECVSFQVPSPTKGTEEVVSISLSLDCAGSKLISEKKEVLLRTSRNVTVIQTDKPMYKPGQTVKFRIVTLDKNFLAATDKYPEIEMRDSKGNRIGQWLNAVPEQGILDLSHPLSSEPPYGTYTIKCKEPRGEQPFEVMEYVLPKYEMKINLPTVVSHVDEHVSVSVCARYTYGKPVNGKVQATLCRKAYGYRVEDICKTFNGQTDSSGCFKTETETGHFEMSSDDYSSELEAKAQMTEDGTGVEMNATSSCPISKVLAKVTFEDTDPHYKPGMLYRGVGQYRPLGYQDFWELYEEAEKTVKRFWVDGKSYVSIRPQSGPLQCGQQAEVTVDYTLDSGDVEEKSQEVVFNYLVAAKGTVAHHGQKKREVSKSNLAGSFSFLMPISADLAPSATLLVYAALADKKMAAESTTFAIDKCFKNEVSLSFSEEETLPGSEVTMHLQASPGSLCSIRAVDKSVLLLKPEAELSSSSVYSLFSFLNQRGYPSRVSEYSRPCKPRPLPRPIPVLPVPLEPVIEPPPWALTRSRRSFRPYPRPYPRNQDQPDAFSLFMNAGLKVLTNLNVRQPQDCLYRDNGRFGVMPIMVKSMARQAPAFRVALAGPRVFDEVVEMNEFAMPTEDEPEENIRKDFPETWLWKLVLTGPSGKTDMSLPVPDTITDWKANCFCMARDGFGISQVTSLKTYKPFFVDTTMPYSVVRGESFTMKATVFNYLKNCIAIVVTLVESQDFEVEPCVDCSYSSCLCENDVKTFSWNMKPKALGEINITVSAHAVADSKICGERKSIVPEKGSKDTLRKVLLVKAEGVPEEKTHSSLMCNGASEKISLKLPSHAVPNSERAEITVVGDIMGTAMNNIAKLLARPSGCGEQNMIKFAPITVILQYLKNTDQMTDETKAKANEFMISGYQQELNYKHPDGSYSAFGSRDASGNTWLTAFVVKCFHAAKAHIPIDEKHINEGVRWLKKIQKPNGSFSNEGKLLHQELKGGVADEISLSVYVMMALLETGMPASDPVMDKAMQFLESQDVMNSTLYNKALVAVVYSMQGNIEKRDQLLNDLQKHAIKKDGEMYWTERPQKAEKESYWSKPVSVDVELTSYALKAYLSGKNVSDQDKKTAVPVVKWLTKQQNAQGGFASTQDTMVALDALAKFAELTYSPAGQMTVSVTSAKGFQHEFAVGSSNRLLLQQKTLPEIPGEYTATSTGNGCAYVHTILRYNVPPPKSVEAFSLEVMTDPKECTEKSGKRVKLSIRLSYTGGRSSTNMVLVEVKMVSGFSPDKDTVKALQKNPLVKRTEISEDKTVSVYLDEVTREPQEHSFYIEQEVAVSNLQPAVVKAYDYYEIDEEAQVEYNAPCH
ncbi:alpha-2-macroglobulin-like protein 1 [Lissotriton helveticus]